VDRMPVIVVAVLLALGAGSSPAQDCLDSIGRSPHGVNNHVAAEGATAVMGNGAAMQVVDLTDPTAPVVLGEVHTARVVNAVAVAGDRAVAATWDELYVVDIGTPAAPVVDGVLEFTSSRTISAMQIVGDRVYLAGGDLDIIDIGTPSAPTLLGSWTELDTRDLAVVGSYAVVTVGDDGLRVVDVSDPAMPAVAGQLDLGPDRRASALDLTGSHAIVAGYDSSVPGDRLFSVDLGDPANPSLVGVTPGIGSDIAVRGGLAMVTDIGGLGVWDVTDPTSPQYRGGVGIHYNDGKRIAAIAGYGLVSNDLHGLAVVDLSDPTDPVVVAEVGVPGKAMEADAEGDLLVVAAEVRGLRLVDVADPSHPVELGFSDAPIIATDVDVEDGFAYAVGYGGNGFVVVDVNDPTAPAVVATLPGSWGGDAIKVRNGYAYVACVDPGLRIIDVSIPSAPVEVESLVLPGYLTPFGTMDVADGVAVVWLGPADVQVVDVSNPASPFVASTIDTIYGVTGGVALRGSWLFLGDGPLRIFDLGVPSAPVELPSYVPVGTGGFLPIVETVGSVAYLVSTWLPGSPMIEAVNIGDAASPSFVGTSLETWDGFGLAFSRSAVHSVSEISGIETFAQCRDPVFADGFETGDTSAWGRASPKGR